MSEATDLRERLARLSPKQRALLDQRLAAGRDAAVSSEYLAMVPAVPLRTEAFGRPNEPTGQVTVYPASHSQQRMWFLHEYSERLPVYVIPSSFHLIGPLDEGLLLDAVSDVVRRHDTLRTTFVMAGEQLLQYVASGAEFAFEAENFQAVPETERSAAANRYLEEVASRTFDLAAAPGFRVALARLGPEEHVLCFVLHHIISDGWSRSNLWREVGGCYAARAAGIGMPLPPLPVQFVDYAAWQEGQLSGGVFEKQAEYWKAQLAGELEPLNLPSDRPRPSKESFRGARAEIHLDSELTARLMARAREEGATLFMILLAAFKVLLHRYTGREDLLVGVPIANRQRVEVEALVGFFVNTLVMRTSLADQPTFREVLSRVKEAAVQAYAHQDMPFERLVELLQLRRDAGAAKLFDVTFALQDFPAVSLELPGILTAPWRTETHTAKFDFSLAVEKVSAGWMATAVYNTDLFDADRVVRMLGRWHVLLESIASDPGQLLADIPELSAQEPQQPLVEWNQTEREYPRDKGVHQLFEAQVERTPDAVAVVFEDQSLTYLELNSRANQLAHHLRGLGVGPEKLVVLFAERSLELVVGLLGILKAGGGYVPLDATCPPDRLKAMIEETNPTVLITRSAMVEHLSMRLPPIFNLDTDWPSLASENSTNPFSGVGSANLAYAIFTSGSTGRPKGVLIEHRHLVNYVNGIVERLSLPSALRYAMVSSFATDLGHTVLFPSLVTGGALHVISRERGTNPNALASYFRSKTIDVVKIVPSHLEMLLQSVSPGQAPDLIPRRVLVLGGESSSWRMLERIQKMAPECRIINHYGPTETTVGVLAHEIEHPRPAHHQTTVPLGRPLPNARVYVVDPQMRRVGVGVPGELLLGGEGVARGYLNRPDETSARFVADPFGCGPEDRCYKSGDRGKWLPDGTIEFLGRVDYQVKIRGYRIELGEIERLLATCAGVRQAVVLANAAATGGKCLAAYLVVDGNFDPADRRMRRFMEEKLPDHMIPSRFLMVPAFPLTPGGKVDRSALERLEGVELEVVEAGYVAPRNEPERALVEIWQTALRRERVGIHDNFFHLGGHSLLAVAICSRVKHLLNLEIPLRWIFDNPTIESLSERIESLLCGRDLKGSEPIRRADRQGPFPMSFAQQGMWLLQQMLPDPAAYNVPKAVRLSGRVNRECVRGSLRVILERHEVLRAALVKQGEDLVQRVADAKDFPLPWREVDLRSSAIPEQASVMQQVLEEEARRAFDLAEAPLWRILWIQLAEDDQVLACTFHHSIMDEWSLRLLFQELSCLYHADGNEESAGLPELPMQYADFAIWQRERLRGREMEAQRDFWSEQLRDLPSDLDLRCDIPKPLHRSGRGAIQSFRLAGEVAARLNVLSREENATSFMTALAAYQVWLYRFTGQDDLVVATPITGRERREFQNLIGFFLNTLPIRCRMKGHQGFKEILRQVRQTVLDAFDHARLPFEEMVELAVKEREAHSQPLHQVMFVFLEQVLPQLILDRVKGYLVPMHNHTSKCDLIFSVMASEQGWDCQLEYACDIFTQEEAGRMAGHLKEMLEAIAEAPQKPIDQLRLMPDSERHRILVEWNQTGRSYPRDKCVHQIFEEQVNRAPEAVALQCGDVCLSYQEVNFRANRLAHHLRSLGVAPDVPVGLCTERSVEMIVALLGILKAGGAYVPLDPKLPFERLRVLLHDVNAPLVLCQRQWRDHIFSLAGESSLGGQVLGLEDLLESLEGSDSSDLPSTNKPGDLAYVMFTSGTTGKPKGVMVPHRGIVRLVVDADYVELGPADVLLQFAPISFDASTFEIWGSLLNGAKLVLPPSESFDLAELGSAITGHGVTTLWLTAALFHQMVELQPSALAGVRQLLAGGDVLSPARVRDYLEMPGHGRLINGYGPTENTTFTCCGVLDEASQVGASVPIGRPIAGTTVYILDKQGEPVPPGVAGELHAGGDGLARGYLNAPELTQEKFVADPFSRDPQARLYKTGDLARWRPDGTIEFLGRFDHQVKIRGYRIELGEIEHALRCCPGVSDAVVVVNEAKSGDKQLFAYLVGMASPQADPASLRARLCSTLPEYMLPSAFVWLDQLPLTPNGKVDRSKLPAPDQNPSKDAQPSDQARSLLEHELIRIWERLFQRSGIGRNDNFFDLGGHSLQAARLASEIEKLLDRKIPIATLFQSPTIASFARRLTDDNWAPAWSSLVPLQPSGSKPPLFLIHGRGGDVYVFLDLARTMKNDRPIYGVQAVGLDGRAPRHTSVEEMARHYAREIRSLQPEGPYHLAGFSLGGWIAYAVAQELSSEGGTVAFLGLLDTQATSHVSLKHYLWMLLPHLRKRFGVHLRHWRELPLAERGQYFLGRWNALSYFVLRKRLRTQLPTESNRDIQQEDQPDYYEVASALYRPKVYSGHVDFFAAKTSTKSPYAFWRQMAHGGVSIHHVSGTHETMLEATNIESLVKSIEVVLSNAG